jgi:hypothetical protein
MSKPFEIKFDFLVADSRMRISLRARAEVHHSEPYYVVSDFSLEKDHDVRHYPSILPDQHIKRLNRQGVCMWVHKDSERESLLSMAIGQGIERALKDDEIVTCA